MSFYGQRIFGVSPHDSHAFLHFHRLSPLGMSMTNNNGSFTRGGVYPCLLLPYTYFHFHVCNRATLFRRHPMVPSPPSNTKRSVDPYNALTPMSCDVPVHKCNEMHHCMPIPCNMYNECYMDNQAHAFNHASWIIISICI